MAPDPPSPTPFPFTDREWVTLFPVAPPALPLAPPLLDPAKELREAEALTAEGLLAALNAASPLRRATQLQLLAGKLTRWPLAVFFVYACLSAAAVGCVAPLLADVVAPQQLAVGVTCVLLQSFVWLPIAALSVRFRARIQQAANPHELSGHPLAIVARWLQLATRQERDLLAHDPADSLCPCAKSACAGNTPTNAFRLRILELVGQFSVLLTALIFTYWTSFSAPGAFSAQWWVGFTGVLALVWMSMPMFSNVLGRASAGTPSLLLSLRLHHRAVTIVLGGLLDRYRTALQHGGTVPDEASEPYLVLLPALASTWETRFPIPVSGGPALFGHGVVPLMLALVNAASGSCIPLYTILPPVYAFIMLIQDLVNFSVANSQVSAVARLVSDCRREVRALLVLAGPDPSPYAARALERHLDLLASFENAEPYQARFLGFPVGFGMLRTVLATVLTVCIGMGTLLRSSGVRLTTLFACPAG